MKEEKDIDLLQIQKEINSFYESEKKKFKLWLEDKERDMNNKPYYEKIQINIIKEERKLIYYEKDITVFNIKGIKEKYDFFLCNDLIFFCKNVSNQIIYKFGMNLLNEMKTNIIDIESEKEWFQIVGDKESIIIIHPEKVKIMKIINETLSAHQNSENKFAKPTFRLMSEHLLKKPKKEKEKELTEEEQEELLKKLLEREDNNEMENTENEEKDNEESEDEYLDIFKTSDNIELIIESENIKKYEKYDEYDGVLIIEEKNYFGGLLNEIPNFFDRFNEFLELHGPSHKGIFRFFYF
jgi:hypothetical protein